MLSAFFVFFGIVGTFLNWPIIRDGFFDALTHPWEFGSFSYNQFEFSEGFLRIDGEIIIGLSLIILISVFFRTTKFLLNLKTFFLALITIFLILELYFVYNLKLPLYSYTGLLYSFIFYFSGFLTSLLKIGSIKSLNTVFQKKQMTESKMFSQTFSQVLNTASTISKVKITSLDNINEQWKKGVEKTFENNEIRIGRNSDWANIWIGNEWDLLSRKQGIMRIVGKTMIYESVSSNYSFAINKKPFSEVRELPDNSTLSLISGYGPNLEVSFFSDKHSVFHPNSVKRVGEIAIDEFKKVQSTFKILIIIALLALPLLLGFTSLQKENLNNYISSVEEKNSKLNKELEIKIKKINQLDELKKKSIKKLRELKKIIKQNKNKKNDLLLKTKIVEYRAVKKEFIKDIVSKEFKHIAKIIDIKLQSQKISIYFPFITILPDNRILTGTGFFAKNRKEVFYLVCEKDLVYDNKTKKWGKTFFFIYPETWNKFRYYSDLIRDKKESINHFKKDILKFSKSRNLMEMDGTKWKGMNDRIIKNGIMRTVIKDLPEYLFKFIPVIDYKISFLDKVVFYGFEKNQKKYIPGIISDYDEKTINPGLLISPQSPSGGLIKLSPNGLYSIIGIYNSSKTGSESKISFVRFQK